MDELAAAAAVVSMSISDNDDEDSELEDAPSALCALREHRPVLEADDGDKENHDDLPVVREQRAANPKVWRRPLTPELARCLQPVIS